MPVDRKKMRELRDAQHEGVVARLKAIIFPMPDLSGPEGNAYWLLGTATKLMRDAGISNIDSGAVLNDMRSGDYDHLLRVLQQNFTIAVAHTEYLALPDDVDVTSLRPGAGGEEEDWTQFDEPAQDAVVAAELDEAMDDYEAHAERDRKIAEVQDRISAEVRAELGLEPNDVVIVQVKKSKVKPVEKSDG